jgi:hypothetical protein
MLKDYGTDKYRDLQETCHRENRHPKTTNTLWRQIRNASLGEFLRTEVSFSLEHKTTPVEITSGACFRYIVYQTKIDYGKSAKV